MKMPMYADFVNTNKTKLTDRKIRVLKVDTGTGRIQIEMFPKSSVLSITDPAAEMEVVFDQLVCFPYQITNPSALKPFWGRIPHYTVKYVTDGIKAYGIRIDEFGKPVFLQYEVFDTHKQEYTRKSAWDCFEDDFIRLVEKYMRQSGRKYSSLKLKHWELRKDWEALAREHTLLDQTRKLKGCTMCFYDF